MQTPEITIQNIPPQQITGEALREQNISRDVLQTQEAFIDLNDSISPVIDLFRELGDRGRVTEPIPDVTLGRRVRRDADGNPITDAETGLLRREPILFEPGADQATSIRARALSFFDTTPFTDLGESVSQSLRNAAASVSGGISDAADEANRVFSNVVSDARVFERQQQQIRTGLTRNVAQEGVAQLFDIARIPADIVGLHSDRNEQLRQLERDLAADREEINRDVTLNAREREDALVEIARQGAEQRREIERRLNEDKADYVRNFVTSAIENISRLIQQEFQAAIVRRLSEQFLLPALSGLGPVGLVAAGVGGTGFLQFIGELFRGSFHDPVNDRLAQGSGRQSARELVNNYDMDFRRSYRNVSKDIVAKQLYQSSFHYGSNDRNAMTTGAKSARDLAQNYNTGFYREMQSIKHQNHFVNNFANVSDESTSTDLSSFVKELFFGSFHYDSNDRYSQITGQQAAKSLVRNYDMDFRRSYKDARKDNSVDNITSLVSSLYQSSFHYDSNDRFAMQTGEVAARELVSNREYGFKEGIQEIQNQSVSSSTNSTTTNDNRRSNIEVHVNYSGEADPVKLGEALREAIDKELIAGLS